MERAGGFYNDDLMDATYFLVVDFLPPSAVVDDVFPFLPDASQILQFGRVKARENQFQRIVLVPVCGAKKISPSAFSLTKKRTETRGREPVTSQTLNQIRRGRRSTGPFVLVHFANRRKSSRNSF